MVPLNDEILTTQKTVDLPPTVAATHKWAVHPVRFSGRDWDWEETRSPSLFLFSIRLGHLGAQRGKKVNRSSPDGKGTSETASMHRSNGDIYRKIPEEHMYPICTLTYMLTYTDVHIAHTWIHMLTQMHTHLYTHAHTMLTHTHNHIHIHICSNIYTDAHTCIMYNCKIQQSAYKHPLYFCISAVNNPNRKSVKITLSLWLT